LSSSPAEPPSAWVTKALLPYQGRPFLEHLLDVTHHPKIGARRVVLGVHAEPIAKAIHLAPMSRDQCRLGKRAAQLDSSSAEKPARLALDGMLLCLVDHPH